VREDVLREVLFDATDAVFDALSSEHAGGPLETRPGHYGLDLVADDAACAVLKKAGLRVLSEESGFSGPSGPLLAVLDPVDGSTNAHRGLPFYSTSICVLDDEGPRMGVVVNQATGVRYEATRGSGARRDGEPIVPSGCRELSAAIVGISGVPARHLGWWQFRALGAASLEFCAVAEGTLDAYRLVGGQHLFGWDYLGGLLICHEAGAVCADPDGADLLVRDDTPRRPLAAATPELLAALLNSEEPDAG
jgi:myo-inositol-1(or 4)-monophosphatase